MNLVSMGDTVMRDEGATTASWVERNLRRAIVRLELRPGSQLSEQEIADDLKVSRQPVREALISLAKSKLVEIRPKRGTYVVKISARQMMEARFVREAIETAIARRACETFDSWTRVSIDAIIDRQTDAKAVGDYNRFQHEDEQFHLALATGSGCPLAWNVIADIKSHIDRVCNLQLRKPESMGALIDEHHAIIQAIDAKDADRAVAAMLSHLSGILSDLPRIEAENREMFER